MCASFALYLTGQSGDHVPRKIRATQWTNWARGFVPAPITHDSMRLDSPGRIVDRAISRIEIQVVRVAPQPQVASNDVQRRSRQSKAYQHVTRHLIDVLGCRNFFANYRFKQRWVCAGTFPAKRGGGGRGWLRSDVERWLHGAG